VHDASVTRGVGLSRLIDQANAVRAADDEPDLPPAVETPRGEQ